MLVELIDSAQLWLTGLALNKLKELREAPDSAPVLVVGAGGTSAQQLAQSSESQLLKQFFSWKYECLAPDAILELQEHEVSYIATQLECDEDLATRLLRHFKWSSQAVLEAYALRTHPHTHTGAHTMAHSFRTDSLSTRATWTRYWPPRTYSRLLR